ncbi:MAG: chemotaxis protein CheD, partial [Thermoplasmata archaeon]
TSDSSLPSDITIDVPAGSYKIHFPPGKLRIHGLGSCIAVALYSRVDSIGALTHAMLPDYSSGIDKTNPDKYVDSSTKRLIEEMISRGIKKYNLKAKIVGGAQMFSFLPKNSFDIGKRNIEMARKILLHENITVIAEDTGGNSGRSVLFDLTDYSIKIKTTSTVYNI